MGCNIFIMSGGHGAQDKLLISVSCWIRNTLTAHAMLTTSSASAALGSCLAGYLIHRVGTLLPVPSNQVFSKIEQDYPLRLCPDQAG